MAACRGRKASVARAVGRSQSRDLERAIACHAWQGPQPSAVTRRRSRAMPGKASGRAVRLEDDRELGDSRRADKSDRKRNEWIKISEC
jgi:hypothetical protein